jgi:drug/metabolite transporter (DMT)-like permease
MYGHVDRARMMPRFVVIIALVLFSALLHATWNALLRLEKDKDRSLILAIVFGTLFALIIAGGRWAAGAVPFSSIAGLGFTLLAGVIEAIYFATLARAMERGRLGVVYTVSRGGAVLAIWPLSIALFSEAVSARSIAGSVAVLAGLVCCGLGAGSAGGAGGEARDRQRAAVGWSIACAVSIAAYHLAYKAALVGSVNPSACFAVSLGTSAAINVLRLGGDRRRALGPLLRARWPRLLLMGLMCGGSFLILVEALARGGSGFVLTLRNTSVLFAAVMAWGIGERPRRLELAGAALVAVGATVMAASQVEPPAGEQAPVKGLSG